MPPAIATAIIIGVICGLFTLDRECSSAPSRALWLPVAWLLIHGSRPVSQWLSLFGYAPSITIDTPDVYLDGSPLDRVAYIGLLALGMTIAILRYPRTAKYVSKNWPLMLFLLYCAVSVLWSDYGFVAFKRWTKIIGDVLVVSIIVTDVKPIEAIKRVFARVAFVLVPLSVLLIKYYPDIGREYNRWTWLPSYRGVAETKNGLGMLCLVFGLSSLWRVITVYLGKLNRRSTQSAVAHSLILGMVVWLLWMSNSITAAVCFVLAAGLMTFAMFARIVRKSAVVHLLVLVPTVVVGAVLFSGSGGAILSTLGRDATLTGRTGIWDAVLSVSGNPFFGSGFESFWLGDRLQKIWDMTMQGLQEAHNGYLEVYLNLGWVGVGLIALLIWTGYRNVISELRNGDRDAPLKLAFFFTALLYNFTEAGFRETTIVWTAFLIAIASPPLRHVNRVAPMMSNASFYDGTIRRMRMWSVEGSA